MTSDRYGSDVLASDWRAPARGRATAAEATVGLVVEEVMTDFCGEIVAVDRDLGTLTLEDRRGRRRAFPLGPGFLLEGRPVALTAPVTRTAPTAPRRTASGSVAVPGARARIARESRIFVEGRHDAELVEKVWGDDLRVEGVVVEYLGGVDDLVTMLRDFGPGPGRRVGVLVVGHPFVDVWAGVKPERLGLAAWPDVPRDVEWKHGICAALGWPHADQADLARAWQQILSRVTTYADCEPALLGRVEELIDFVTAS